VTLRGWLVAGTVVACIAGQASARDFTRKPDFIQGTPIRTHYDGVSNDLLTAGLGANGLQLATPPPIGNPPTAEDLRKLAIYANYRAIVDTTTAGGYGVLYGPGPGPGVDGHANSGAGMIAGDETIAFATENRGRNNLTLMVQVPDTALVQFTGLPIFRNPNALKAVRWLGS